MQPVADTLSRVNDLATRRLDSLAQAIQPVRQQMPIDEYMPRALAEAQRNDKFARALARSIYQSQQLRGAR